jgi:hypothetical protein
MKLGLLAAAMAALLNVMPAYCTPAVDMQHEPDVQSMEAAERELAFQLAPIKSQEDLRLYLLENQDQESPLMLLSPGAKARFLDSLVFTKGGLASFDYRDIQAELTATQAYQLLALFGAQRSTKAIPGLRISSPSDAAIVESGSDPTIMADYQDYWCASPATCDRRVGSICIGSNCQHP